MKIKMLYLSKCDSFFSVILLLVHCALAEYLSPSSTEHQTVIGSDTALLWHILPGSIIPGYPLLVKRDGMEIIKMYIHQKGNSSLPDRYLYTRPDFHHIGFQIKAVQSGDAGYFTFQNNGNTTGEDGIIKSTLLLVHAPPSRPKITPVNRINDTGELVLSCDSSCTSRPADFCKQLLITWYINSKIVDSQHGVKINTTFNLGSEQLQSNDEITCMAQEDGSSLMSAISEPFVYQESTTMTTETFMDVDTVFDDENEDATVINDNAETALSPRGSDAEKHQYQIIMISSLSSILLGTIAVICLMIYRKNRRNNAEENKDHSSVIGHPDISLPIRPTDNSPNRETVYQQIRESMMITSVPTPKLPPRDTTYNQAFEDTRIVDTVDL